MRLPAVEEGGTAPATIITPEAGGLESWRLIAPLGAETAVTAAPAPVGVDEGGEGSCPFPFPPTPFGLSTAAAPSVLLIVRVPEAAGALEEGGCGTSAAGVAGELRAVDTCGRGGFVVPGVGLVRGVVVRGGARVEDMPARSVSAGLHRGGKYERRRRGGAGLGFQHCRVAEGQDVLGEGFFAPSVGGDAEVPIVGPGAVGVAAATAEAIDRSVSSECTLDAEPFYRKSWYVVQGGRSRLRV